MQFESYSLTGDEKINIIMGKNGAGKSMLLRALERSIDKNNYGNIKYISPERGGILSYDPNIEQAINSNASWISNTRRNNRVENFRQQTIAQYRQLELNVLRDYEENNEKPKFDNIIAKINGLLEYIEIKRIKSKSTFEIYNKINGDILDPSNISSGEAELIALSIECLIFISSRIKEKVNILLLDEPDVHLHPDLQSKFMIFLQEIISGDDDIKIFITTHSSAIVGSISGDFRICFLKKDQRVLNFVNNREQYEKIVPIFGPHPLSNLFNKAKLLIVEGDDDIRIRQQVVRSTRGVINLFPCEAGSISLINELEKEAQEIIESIYDNGIGFSLRDGDGIEEELEDFNNIYRCRLKCRNAENLLLSDEALIYMGIDFEKLKLEIDGWLTDPDKLTHTKYDILKNFKDGGYNRKEFDIKEIRNMILYFASCEKPREIIVGKAISDNIGNSINNLPNENSIFNYLGEKIVKSILN